MRTTIKPSVDNIDDAIAQLRKVDGEVKGELIESAGKRKKDSAKKWKI